MKFIDWNNRQAGDIGLVRYTSPISALIADFEVELHPEYTGSFVPSHAFVMGYDDLVIESALSRNEDSVAAINSASEYEKLPTQLWRIDRDEAQVEMAVRTFVTEYAKDGYGLINLFGFAVEALWRHLGNPKANNPILHSYVCSQAALLFLRFPSQEKWPLSVNLHNCDPLQLLMLCLANEAK